MGTEFWTAVAAKAAFSAGVALVAESLRETPPAAPSFVNEATSRKQLARASNGPRRAIYGEVGRVSGNLVYVANGTDPAYVHFVIALADHRCQAINDCYLGDEKVGALDAAGNCTAGRFAGHVRIRKYLGTQTTTDADLAAECPEWAAKSRVGYGVTYVYLRIKRSRDVFPQGLPVPRFDVLGKADILDPRTGLTGYTNNAALCTLDYILWRRGYASALAEVDQPSWIAAANVCDEDVAVPGGGTQKRYRVNGSFTLDQGRAQILDAMRQAMAGMANYIMGQWYGGAGAAEAPVMDIDERDLRGGYRVRPRVADDKVYNAVRGIYTETAQWTETDFPPITSSVYEAQDGGERLYKDVKLVFETDPYRAQRLAKIDLERHRQQIVVDWPMRIKGLKLRPWNIVRLSVAKMGWVNKQFRVVGWDMNLRGGPTLTLEEYAPAIYSMAVDELVTADPAPDTTLPDPFSVAAPTGLTLSSGTAELLRAGDGTIISRIRADWPVPADPYVRTAELQYRAAGSAEWQPGPRAADATTGFAHIVPVADGTSYEARIRFENAIGVRSAWTTAASHTVVGKTEPPSDIPWASLDGNRISWGAIGDADLAGYIWRWQPGNNRSRYGASPLHDGIVVSSPFTMNPRPSGPVTLIGVAVDTSGNESDNVAAIVTNLGDPVVANVIYTKDCHAAGFAGVRTNATVDGATGDLMATADPSPVAWTDDAAPAWTNNSDPAWDADTYKAMGYADSIVVAAADSGAQLTLSAAIAAESHAIDYRRDGAHPAWSDDLDPAWTGDADAAWDVEPWQAWPGAITVDPLVYEFRVSTQAGRVRGRISALSLLLDVEDIGEVLSNIAIAAEGTRLPLTRAYRQIEVVNLTQIHDGGAARRLEVMDKSTALGPLVQGFDSSNAGASAHADVVIQGF